MSEHDRIYTTFFKIEIDEVDKYKTYSILFFLH